MRSGWTNHRKATGEGGISEGEIGSITTLLGAAAFIAVKAVLIQFSRSRLSVHVI